MLLDYIKFDRITTARKPPN